MWRLCLLILFVYPWSVFAQTANFEDDFSDQDLSEWVGDTSHFTFILEGDNVLLQQTAPSAGTTQVSTPSTQVVGYWEFFLRLDGFSPSAGNKAEIYLMSSSSDLNSALNGYVLQAGENGSGDVLRLFRVTNGVQDNEVLIGTTSIASGGDYRIRVDRDNAGNWTLSVATSYSAPVVQEATGTDNTFTTATHLGLKTTYTSSRVDKFTFDFKIDIPPIAVKNVGINDTQIGVSFNIPYASTSVQTTDFTLNPGSITPSSITEVSSDSVHLNFNAPIPRGELTLAISAIDDASNQTTLADTTLTLFNYDDYVEGAVVINEIMKDEPTGMSEYIELKNTTSLYLNLKDWELGDNSSLSVLSAEDLTLLPDSFIVISSDTASLQSFGNIYSHEVSLPAFNNGADQVRVYNQNSTLIDSLEYDESWGGENVALERISSTVSAIYKENWGNSLDLAGGTPGRRNSVPVDNSPPSLESLVVEDAQSITLVFNETVDSTSAQTKTNYSISPSLTIQSIQTDQDSTTITFSSTFESGLNYSISIQNQSDVFGNTANPIDASFKYLEVQPAAQKDIVINEILYRKANEDAPEFVEIYNRSEKNIDLSAWTLSDATQNEATFPPSIIIEADSYLVLTNSLSFAQTSSSMSVYYLSNFPSLNDAGDQIVLKNAEGAIIDSLAYTSEFGGTEAGISTERIDPNAASNDPQNWRSSENGTTPAMQNSVYTPDELAPSLLFARAQLDGRVFVAFNEFVDLDNAQITINGNTANIVQFDTTEANEVLLDGNGVSLNEVATIEAINFEDIVGNSTASDAIEIAMPITPGAVVINEILFDPLADNEDNLPDQTEYIELYNTRDYAVSLEGLLLHDAPDEQNEIDILNPVSTFYKWIPARSYFLVYAENEAEIFMDSQLQEYFELTDEQEAFTARIDRSSLSLSASNDAIYISDSTVTNIDSVFYSEKWHNPNRVSVKGVALERINPHGPSNEAQNWSSSTDVRGGTPTAENSIYQESGEAPASTGVSVNPNPFSPDGDGFEDFVSINYTLDQPDYLLRIRIFDRYGREVRELVNGKAAGFTGSIIWDGLKDDGGPNRVGIYILFFEAYDSANGKNRTFKETVVLARKF